MVHLIACQSTTHVVDHIAGRCGQSYINHTGALAAPRSIYNEYIAKPEYNAIVGSRRQALLCSAARSIWQARSGRAGRAVGRPMSRPVRALCDTPPTDELAATRRLFKESFRQLQRALVEITFQSDNDTMCLSVCLSVHQRPRQMVCRAKFVDAMSNTHTMTFIDLSWATAPVL